MQIDIVRLGSHQLHFGQLAWLLAVLELELTVTHILLFVGGETASESVLIATLQVQSDMIRFVFVLLYLLLSGKLLLGC